MSKVLLKSGVILSCFCILICAIPFNAIADKVEEVYACGGSGALIKLKDKGWLVVLQSEVGEKQLERIYATALTAFSIGATVGYVNPGDFMSYCGVRARNITVFQIQK